MGNADQVPELIREQQVCNDLRILRIEPRHIYGLQTLPDVHRDPIDRIMIGQAIGEDLFLVSVDSMFDRYPVRLLWSFDTIAIGGHVVNLFQIWNCSRSHL